jgi:hypothetical protein
MGFYRLFFATSLIIHFTAVSTLTSRLERNIGQADTLAERHARGGPDGKRSRERSRSVCEEYVG